MAARDAGEVEQRVRDTGEVVSGDHGDEDEDKRKRIYLAAARMPKKPTLSTSCCTAYLTLSNLTRQSHKLV